MGQANWRNVTVFPEFQGVRGNYYAAAFSTTFGPGSVWLVCAVFLCGFNEHYGLRKNSRSRLGTITTLSGLLLQIRTNPAQTGR